ncbi:AraC family transcriptional regulator [Tateyamaria omphalii]|uniref:AraC family transcriptional regulator n=1 Tax=Tateyamaria omphalii TaxID=299262 RepID=UPI001C99334F|nr:AraC family transcriptional regulator [Tateyamaria omphalii]MBY5935044.1 AraC family transcriptional regulator [Tateyamaria omphalii]
MRQLSNLRTATGIRAVCDVAQDMGLDPAEVLKDTDLAYEELVEPDRQVTWLQEVQAIRNIVRCAPRDIGLGARAGRKLHAFAYGVYGFALLTAPTLRASARLSIEFMKLSTGLTTYSVEETSDRVRIRFDMTDLPPDTHTFAIEAQSVITMDFIAEMLGTPDFNDMVVETPYTDTRYVNDIEEEIGTEVKGSMPGFALSFSSALFDEPLPKSDPATFQYCVDQCKALLEQPDVQPDLWSQKVRDVIHENIGEELNIQTVADLLATTERTLRRRLSEEHTSFRELYLDARLSRARDLLEVFGLHVDAVSWRVGYSEPASFTRAYTKRFGVSPGQARLHKSSVGSG